MYLYLGVTQAATRPRPRLEDFPELPHRLRHRSGVQDYVVRGQSDGYRGGKKSIGQ